MTIPSDKAYQEIQAAVKVIEKNINQLKPEQYQHVLETFQGLRQLQWQEMPDDMKGAILDQLGPPAEIAKARLINKETKAIADSVIGQRNQFKTKFLKGVPKEFHEFITRVLDTATAKQLDNIAKLPIQWKITTLATMQSGENNWIDAERAPDDMKVPCIVVLFTIYDEDLPHLLVHVDNKRAIHVISSDSEITNDQVRQFLDHC